MNSYKDAKRHDSWPQRQEYIVKNTLKKKKPHIVTQTAVGFPGSSDGKEPACNVGDSGSIPESGRSPGEGNGDQLQYSCLENPMDGETW